VFAEVFLFLAMPIHANLGDFHAKQAINAASRQTLRQTKRAVRMSRISVIEFTQKIILISIKNGVGSLYYQAFLNKQRVRLNLKKRIPEDHFSKVDELMKKNTPDANDVNLELENIKARATDIIVRHRLNGTTVDKSKFETELKDNNKQDHGRKK
jgi:hypothetical protein